MDKDDFNARDWINNALSSSRNSTMDMNEVSSR